MKQRKHNTLKAFWLGFPIWIVAILIALSVADCSGGGDVAVPRPKAFPRQQLYDTIRTEVAEAEPLRFYANKDAEIVLPRQGEAGKWINIVYPLYKAKIYCTFTPVTASTRREVVDNRVERMSLNAGGLNTEILSIDSREGFHSNLLITPIGSLTPLQFLSTNEKDWVVSGTVYFEDIPRSVSADSITPSLNAIKDDIIYALSRLGVKR